MRPFSWASSVSGTISKAGTVYMGTLLQIVGFSREVTLIDYGITNDTEKFVTEICIPVTEEE